MWIATTQKTVTTHDSEIIYTFSAQGLTEEAALALTSVYASMVEFGTLAEKWTPTDLAFPEEQLYQFIQPDVLKVLKGMYPDVVKTAYQSAVAYVQSYIGAMFDVEEMLAVEDTTSTGLTLRLALVISTVTFILGSSPNYSEVIELHNKQLHTLLKGLKSGSRNFGKNAIAGDPNVRVSVVKLTNTGTTP